MFLQRLQPDSSARSEAVPPPQRQTCLVALVHGAHWLSVSFLARFLARLTRAAGQNVRDEFVRLSDFHARGSAVTNTPPPPRLFSFISLLALFGCILDLRLRRFTVPLSPRRAASPLPNTRRGEARAPQCRQAY